MLGDFLSIIPDLLCTNWNWATFVITYICFIVVAVIYCYYCCYYLITIHPHFVWPLFWLFVGRLGSLFLRSWQIQILILFNFVVISSLAAFCCYPGSRFQLFFIHSRVESIVVFQTDSRTLLCKFLPFQFACCFHSACVLVCVCVSVYLYFWLTSNLFTWIFYPQQM